MADYYIVVSSNFERNCMVWNWSGVLAAVGVGRDRLFWPANYNNNTRTAYFIIGYSRIETSGHKKIICGIGIVCPHMFITWHDRIVGSSTWLR